MASRYQQLIGLLRWAVELGQIDILHEMAIMSQYLALPREGHLEKVYSIFSYLGKHECSCIVFDDNDPVFQPGTFIDCDWLDVYDMSEMNEELPPDMPEPQGRPVTITMFVDANHAGNVVTCQSHLGILIFVQNAPIIWYSKQQNGIEVFIFWKQVCCSTNW